MIAHLCLGIVVTHHSVVVVARCGPMVVAPMEGQELQVECLLWGCCTSVGMLHQKGNDGGFEQCITTVALEVIVPRISPMKCPS